MYQISKGIRYGDLVSLRGNKLVRYGKGMKLFGVYQYQERRVTIPLDGEKVAQIIPEGFHCIPDEEE